MTETTLLHAMMRVPQLTHTCINAVQAANYPLIGPLRRTSTVPPGCRHGLRLLRTVSKGFSELHTVAASEVTLLLTHASGAGKQSEVLSLLHHCELTHIYLELPQGK